VQASCHACKSVVTHHACSSDVSAPCLQQCETTTWLRKPSIGFKHDCTATNMLQMSMHMHVLEGRWVEQLLAWLKVRSMSYVTPGFSKLSTQLFCLAIAMVKGSTRNGIP
jgi:hypothetical protein